MENSKLYELLDIPHEVASRLEEYGRVRDIRIPDAYAGTAAVSGGRFPYCSFSEII